MPKLTLILLALAITAGAAAAASTVDFTPLPAEMKFDGAVRRFVRFRCYERVNGRGLMDYTPPWPISGSGDRATMMIPNTDAKATLRRVRTAAPLDFEDPERLLAWAREFLPEHAEALEFGSIEQDPLMIDGQPTVELTARYTLFGLPVVQSLLLCRRAVSGDTELFVFGLEAKPAEFEQFHRVYLRSLYSIVGF